MDVLPVRYKVKALVEILQQFINHFCAKEKDPHSLKPSCNLEVESASMSLLLFCGVFDTGFWAVSCLSSCLWGCSPGEAMSEWIMETEFVL